MPNNQQHTQHQQNMEGQTGTQDRYGCPEYDWQGDVWGQGGPYYSEDGAPNWFFKCRDVHVNNVLENTSGTSDLEHSSNPGWNRSRVPCDNSSAYCSHVGECAPWWIFSDHHPAHDCEGNVHNYSQIAQMSHLGDNNVVGAAHCGCNEILNEIHIDDFNADPEPHPDFTIHEDCWCCPDCYPQNGYPDVVGGNGYPSWAGTDYPFIWTEYCVHPNEAWEDIQPGSNMSGYCNPFITGANYFGMWSVGACVNPQTGMAWWPVSGWDPEDYSRGCVWGDDTIDPGFIDHCACKGFYGQGGSMGACGYTAVQGECWDHEEDPEPEFSSNCADPGACNDNGEPSGSQICTTNGEWYNNFTACRNECGGCTCPDGTQNCTASYVVDYDPMCEGGHSFCGWENCAACESNECGNAMACDGCVWSGDNSGDDCVHWSELYESECDWPVDCGCGPETCPNGKSEYAPSSFKEWSCDELLCTGCKEGCNDEDICGCNPACDEYVVDIYGDTTSTKRCQYTDNSECYECPTLNGCWNEGGACNNNTASDGTYYAGGCPDGYSCSSTNCVFPEDCYHGGGTYCPGSDDYCKCGTKWDAIEGAFGANFNDIIVNDFYNMSSAANTCQGGTGGNQCGSSSGGGYGYCNTPGQCYDDCIPKWKTGNNGPISQGWISSSFCNTTEPLGSCLGSAYGREQVGLRYCRDGCGYSGDNFGEGNCKANNFGYEGAYYCSDMMNGGSSIGNGQITGGNFSNSYEGEGTGIVLLGFDIHPMYGCAWNGYYQYTSNQDCSDAGYWGWDTNPEAPSYSNRFHGHCYKSDDGGINGLPYCSDKFLRQCDSTCGNSSNYVWFSDYFGGSTQSYCTCDPCSTSADYSYSYWSSGWDGGFCSDVFEAGADGTCDSQDVMCSDDYFSDCNDCGSTDGNCGVMANGCTIDSWVGDGWCDCNACQDEFGCDCYPDVAVGCCNCDNPSSYCCNSTMSGWHPGIFDGIHAKRPKKRRKNVVVPHSGGSGQPDDKRRLQSLEGKQNQKLKNELNRQLERNRNDKKSTERSIRRRMVQERRNRKNRR